MLKILIADDHPIVRKGLKQILEEGPHRVQCDEARDGNEVLHKTQDHVYDLVLLDIAMPKVNGIDCLKQIKKEQPRTPVLIISMYPEEQYAVRAFKAGASGYLTSKALQTNCCWPLKRSLPANDMSAHPWLKSLHGSFKRT